MIRYAARRFGALAALLTGALFLCSRDVGPIGPLILIAPVPILLYALSAARGWPVVIAAFAAGGLGAGGIIWAYGSILPASVLVFWVIGQALGFMLVVLLTRWVARASPAWVACLSYPLFATGLEFLFSLASPHGSFGAIGYALVDLLPLLQAASVGGVPTLSFIAALVPMTLTLLILSPGQWRGIVAAGVLPVALVCVLGLYRMTEPAETKVRIALAAIDQAQGDDDDQSDARLTRATQSYAALVRTLASGRPDVVVLPEKVFPGMAGAETPAKTELASLSTEVSALIVAGFDEVRADGAHENAAMMFAPDGAAQRYLKQRLVPGLEAQFVPGAEPLIAAGYGVAICKDLDFAPLIREYGRRGVRQMLVPAWDFVRDGRLHARMAVVRGVENGFALARSAAMGRLTISDSHGRIVSEVTSSDTGPATLVAEIGLGSGRTPYSTWGDLFGWLTVAAVALLLTSRALLTVTRKTP
jgi:apolipoprotein N-acyltransferase